MAPPPPTDPMLEDEFSFDWLNGYDPAAPVGAHPHESAFDGSSPSAMSTGSQSGISEALLDGTARFPMPAASWHNPFPTGHHGLPSAPVDFGAGSGGPGPDPLGGAPPETVSPKSLMAQTHNPFAETYATPPSMTAVGPPLLGGHHAQSMFPSSMAPRGDSPNPRNLAFAHSALRAPHRSAPDTVTDATRQALLAGLAPPVAGGGGGDPLPRTPDLQRYLTAYLTDFHPHLPFLHPPTLDFQAPEYTPRSGPAPGGGLLLAMAALGARFAGDSAAAQDLFAAAQTMTQRPLDEHRRVASPPPLWLVQALLLIVLHSHTGDDPAAADRARPHCATLVRLARALELHGAADDRPPDPHPAAAPGSDPPAARRAWLIWKAGEERTRTLSALFVLSAFLVAAYHQAPVLTNSELRLDLPCEEALWTAESPQAWAQRGGGPPARADRVSFATALTTLLTASQRGVAPPPDDLRPSTFGCLVLIYALHNYIWETRQRHRGRPWTARETDAMQAHLEPALRAWQTAWARHPAHSLEYPNPFGAGPLSADSIPLLDLAYVRLYVDLGRRRAMFWAPDETSLPAGSPDAAGGDDAPDALPTAVLDPSMRPPDAGAGSVGMPSPRERHLRRAAFYAADSIAMSQRLGTTFAASPCRDLPIQSALCAFDCAQVLAEWLAAVEGRALTPDPGLEEEDRTLVATIGTILARIEAQGSGLPRVAGGYGPQILVATAGLLERARVWPVTGLMARSLEAQARRLQERPLS
ncbi:putative C2H2 transcription factor (AmdX) [Aspergillus candidus]|uniref:Fungal-specific transcription factor domain-domain-containing protein n=1 Tax=Aspergillus candidus TaxID=41067 RepID=A0A2I2F8W7_ASPCN|nr:fungal-specific transcription factor domain-domain-containing protein [Aspergillus candidus]PLB37048.1 fungal-specific transcription factor domain-domain-containing protein [Aspergillus candidus]